MPIPEQPENPEPPKGAGMAGLGPAAAALEDAMQAMRERRAEVDRERGTSPPDVDAQFDAIIGGEQPTGQTVMLDILTKAGADGLHWETLQLRLKAAGHEISKATIYRWLDDDAVGQIKPGVWGIKPPN